MSIIENETYLIRPETPADYDAVVSLTREAFWNVYQPGCDEHYIVQRFRSLPDYIPELSLVLEVTGPDGTGELRGHIMWTRAKILADDGREIPILTFGPLSVLPRYQKQGCGSALIRTSMEIARTRFGCGAVAITGNPQYYHRFGFVPGQSLGVYYEDIRSEPTDFFMVRELIPGYLDGVTGVFRDGPGYNVEGVDIEAFDAAFPPKEKRSQPGQFR